MDSFHLYEQGFFRCLEKPTRGKSGACYSSLFLKNWASFPLSTLAIDAREGTCLQVSIVLKTASGPQEKVLLVLIADRKIASGRLKPAEEL